LLHKSINEIIAVNNSGIDHQIASKVAHFIHGDTFNLSHINENCSDNISEA
jgi:hypothetical protein